MTLCNIVGTIVDSGGSPLSGRLDVTLTNLMETDTTSPDTILLTQPRSFTITSGVVNISLRESETKNVTYRFQFFLQTAPSVFALTPILDFFAIVPNAVTYEFASLVPTGITSDTLATGARRIAREIFADPNLTNQLGGAIGILRQDAKPSSGQPGQIWIQPSSGRLWRWNAALSNWTSAPFVASFAATASADTTLNAALHAGNAAQILLESVRYQWVLQSPINGANLWALLLGYAQITSSSRITLDTRTLDANPGAAQSATVTLNQSINPASSAQSLWLEAVRTGNPGAISFQATCTYSWIHP